MAIDNTPPRLRLIVTIAVIVIITLLGLNFVFESYFAIMTDQARFEKLAPTTAKNEQQAAEAAALAGGKMPIDKAMAQLKGARGEAIEPKQSEDVGAMTGWSKLPKQAPLPVLGGAAHVTDSVPMLTGGGTMATDGGAMATDGGTMATDGGAPHAVPKGAHAPH